MPKYLVSVDVKFPPLKKELTIYAPTEEEAEEKAVDIVMNWNNVEDCEVTDIVEE